MQKKKIFILSCGTNACFNLIRECSENFSDQIEVYGADTTPPEFLASLHYLKEFYRVSPNSSEGYYDERFKYPESYKARLYNSLF